MSFVVEDLSVEVVVGFSAVIAGDELGNCCEDCNVLVVSRCDLIMALEAMLDPPAVDNRLVLEYKDDEALGLWGGAVVAAA